MLHVTEIIFILIRKPGRGACGYSISYVPDWFISCNIYHIGYLGSSGHMAAYDINKYVYGIRPDQRILTF